MAIGGPAPVRTHIPARNKTALQATRRGRNAIEPLENRLLFATYFVDNSVTPATDPAFTFPTIAALRLAVPTFESGDQVLFRAGRTFAGPLVVTNNQKAADASLYVGTFDVRADGTVATDALTSAAPTMSAATILADTTVGSGFGIHLRDTGNVTLRNLKVDGTGISSWVVAHNRFDGSGVFLQNTGAVAPKLANITLDRVEATRFPNRGILVDDRNPDDGTEDKIKTGFDNLRITHSKATHNVIAGIEVLGDFNGAATNYAHSNLYIGYTEAAYNTGRASYTAKHTGSGIVVSDVAGAVIEHSVAHNNGANNDATGGPVGIWAWDSDRVHIRYNESHSNKTDAGADGGGFDLDGGVTNSVVEYNYSHDNDGAGYGIYQFGGARPYFNNVFRYNISARDGRKGAYGAFDFWNGNGANGIRDTHVYNNTVYVTPSVTTTTTTNRKGQTVVTETKLGDPRALRFISGTTDVTVRNNIFQTTGGQMLCQIDARQTNLKIEGNNWWSTGGAFEMKAFAKVYTSLSAFVSGSGYERDATGTLGRSLDPLMVNPAAVPTIGTPGGVAGGAALGGFRLQATSPLRNAGLNLFSRYTFNTTHTTPTADFYGNALPADAASAASFLYSIGAHELA
jgi:hypothetical protein